MPSETLEKTTRIAFYPRLTDERRLADHLYRAVWYLYPLRRQLARVVFPVAASLSVRPPVPPLLDPAAGTVLSDFSEIEFLASGDDLDALVQGADFVFLHDESQRESLRAVIARTQARAQVVRVDHDTVQYADSFYLRFAAQFAAMQAGFMALARARVGPLLEPLRRGRAYLFGSGPNFSLTEGFDFSDGLVVACNSMVVNQAVLDRLDPDLFVIADPIFHAGPSVYAADFRASFVQEMQRRRCPILVPMRDFHIYGTYLPPDVLERVVPVAFHPRERDDEGPRLDLLAEPAVTVTSNILTLFQIPLACTLSREIVISGCDGRPASQNTYFWRHDKSVQINDRMSDIRAAHPAFFDISYDDYYSSHEKTLDQWVAAAEHAGCTVSSLTPSHLLPLRERMSDALLPVLKARRPACRLSVVVPLYNAGRFIGPALDSLLADVGESAEILVIDDFSEDESPDIARDYAQRDPRVLVLQNFRAKGVSGARNTGLALANGDCVCFLDADDTVFPGSIQARMAHLDAHPQVQMVHGHLRFIDEAGLDLGVDVGTKRTVTFQDASGNPASFNTLMFRRDLASRLVFDEGMTNGEDWLAFARLLRLGFASEYVPEGGATYRVHRGSTVIGDMQGHEARLSQVIDWVYAPVEGAASAPAFRDGLVKPPKSTVLQTRRLNAFIWRLFAGDFAGIASDVEDPALAGVLAAADDGLRRRIAVSAVRFFSVHVDCLDAIDDADQARLMASVDLLRDRPQLAAFVGQLDALFGLAQGDRAVGVLRRANALCRAGAFEQALRYYETLMRSDPFYGFLAFNADYCRGKLATASSGSASG